MNCKYCRANCTGAKHDREIALCLGYDPPKTNADRIRSMTNWEMAKFFVRFFDEANADCKKLPCNKCCAGKLCSEGILEWLKQERVE